MSKFMQNRNVKMNKKKILHEPNFHGDLYRSIVPKLDEIKLEKNLDFIDISADDHVILGSSNITGRNWNGSVWYFEDIDSDTQLNVYVARKSFSCGVKDGKFLKDSNEMLIVDDSGVIQLLSLTENTNPSEQLQTIILAEEHEAGITELSLSASGRYFCTSCLDGSIKVWDIERTRVESNEYFDSIKTYSTAHVDIVTSVANHRQQDELFVSCGMDKEALIWDTRSETPASLLYQNDFAALTNIKWHPFFEHIVIVGTEKGDIYMLDIREPDDFVTKGEYFNRSIHRMVFNQSNGLLAICADNEEVKVVDTSFPDIFNLIYEDSKHSDMVRGLAWKNETNLLSCAWDKTVLNHVVVKK